MADHTDESLIREIDEELRHEQFKKTWNRYGKIIVGAAALVVAAVAGYQFWQSHDLKTRQAVGDQFAKAQSLAISGDSTGAADVFKRLAAESGGYGLLARFQQAGLSAANGNVAGALDIYGAIAADNGVSGLYRDLATTLSAALEINDDGADTGAIRTRLTPLTAADNPWRFTAKELMAAVALKDGKTDEARAIYQDMVKDAATSAALRQRATEMLTILR